MKNYLTTILFFIFTTVISFGQETMVIRPGPNDGKGARLHELTPNENMGDSHDFITYYWSFEGTPGNGVSLIQFDLSVLPEDIFIQQATLSLYHIDYTASNGHEGENASYLKRITEPWDHNSVTWNTKPATTTQNQILLPKSTSENQNYTNINVTNFVRDWYINPQNNHGLMIELIEQTIYSSMKFASSFANIEEIRPQITVHYNQVTNNSTLTVFENVVDAYCYGSNTGYINITSVVGGTPPYSFLWSNGKTSNSISNLPAGTYTVIVSDAANNKKIKNYTISEPEPIVTAIEVEQISCPTCKDASINLTVTGGTPPYSILWNNTFMYGFSPSRLAPGTYEYTITDQRRCKKIGMVEIFEPIKIDIPTAFTPNGDGYNDEWIIKNIEYYPEAIILVFNRWGQVVFKARGDHQAWDGKHKGKILPIGTYIYRVEISKTETYMGFLTIIH